MINFIFNKAEEFNNLINKEIENIFTDEYNENIKNLSNLLNEFNFNNDKNKFNEMFIIFDKSILNSKEIKESKIGLNNNKLYENKVIKNTNINTSIEKLDDFHLKRYKFIPEYYCVNENQFLLESVPKSEKENYILNNYRTFEINKENEINLIGQKNNWKDLIKIGNENFIVKGKSKKLLKFEINKWDRLIDEKNENINIKGIQKKIYLKLKIII